MRKMIRLAVLPLIAGAVIGLTACAKTPPECSATDATKALRQVMDDAILEVARAAEPSVRQQDGENVVRRYLASWTFDLSNVTTNGYDEKSRTRACRGKVSIEVPDTKQKGFVELEYSMQMLEDSKSGPFQLMVGRNYQNWARSSAWPATKHYRNTQTAGAWSGTSKCGPSELKSESFGRLPADEAGYAVLSIAGNWAQEDATSVAVDLVVDGGKAEMKIAAGGQTLTRAAEVGNGGQIHFPTKDAFEHLVPDLVVIADGKVTQPNAEDPNVGVRAQARSNTTGAILNAALVRTCKLEMAKK